MLETPDYLAAHFTFALRLADDPAMRAHVAEVMAQPCFSPLARVWKTRESRDSDYRPLTKAAVSEFLADPNVHHVAMDNGRTAEQRAGARFPTGEHNRSWNVADPSFKAYVILPHAPELLEARITCLKALASALRVRFGSIAIEQTYEDAHVFVLAHEPAGAHLSDRQRTERRAHALFTDQLRSRIPGPEWGLFLTDGHLEQLSIAALTSVFTRVEQVRDGLVYAQLTDTPEDARDRARFDRRLDEARSALEPILMDLSKVTFP